MTEALLRSRTISWGDPQISAQKAPQMSGLEFLQAISRGELPFPPIMELLGINGLEATVGHVVFTLEPAEYHYNPIGSVHGGVASTLLDSAMSCAIQSMLPLGTIYTTVELHVNFLRPVTKDTGKVRCEGESIHVGRTIGTAQGRLLDANGKLYAHGTATCLIMQGDK